MRVGLIGWRGMVGSVLMQRMLEEQDFSLIEPTFFTTSNPGGKAPDIGKPVPVLQDAYDVGLLGEMDALISCQGGDYTTQIFPQLRQKNWSGHWIDAASSLRMDTDAVIILDPVNRPVIDQALQRGGKVWVGGNCTVSLMLMALAGLVRHDLIEWVSAMTYQAASGAGAQNMRELIQQMGAIHSSVAGFVQNPASNVLDIDRTVGDCLIDSHFPTAHFGVPLAGSLIPWIDQDLGHGKSREEWKSGVETNKILGNSSSMLVDGLCVRVGSMRCHAQALTIRMRQNLPLDEIVGLIAQGNNWVDVIPNTRSDTVQNLSPAKVSGTLRVPVGRLRKLDMGDDYLSAFTVGDQLLWGAAEPLRRMLRILVESHSAMSV